MRWRDPVPVAGRLLDLAAGGYISTPGRGKSWIERAQKLPYRCKIWLIRKIKERVSEPAGNYLWQRISRRERP